MQARLFDPDQLLPDRLREDLSALLAAEGDAVTWARLDDQGRLTERVLTLRAARTEASLSLRLEFWVPEWMNARGVAAILPAHLGMPELDSAGAEVELGTRPETEWRAELPRLARSCARLMNELWGLTEAPDVVTVET